MRAVIFRGVGDVGVVDVDKPAAGFGEVVIRVKAALMCGTDVKMFRRGHPLVRPPRVIGHEYSGVVVDAGEESGFNVGDRVAGVNSGPCMECGYCKSGRENLCTTLDEALIGFTCDGVFAEYCRIPKRVARVNLLRIGDELPFEEAAFLEPLSCVVHGLSRVNVSQAGEAAILGSGSIGLMHLQVIKHRNPNARVWVFDPHWEKLEKAVRLGADKVVNIREEDLRSYRRGFQLVVESVGRVEAWEDAVELVDKGGVVLFFGGCPKGTKLSLDTYKTHYEELTLLGAFHHTPRDVKQALEMIKTGRLKLRELIGAEVSLEEIREGFEAMIAGRAAKVLVRP
ncbi:MAG TPA: alcohol dehydrogenase [Candidatus Caldiarchaeum subterraneum]|uniref:Alcohol dehydrogenase n=1 Tax=Caldiarchaeum subterraneum TaxID=311458 RepID=A0A833EA97_CALS0|nr:alcohol dehydrogenase [Candidatus Caldarchaeum subterraneum]